MREEAHALRAEDGRYDLVLDGVGELDLSRLVASEIDREIEVARAAARGLGETRPASHMPAGMRPEREVDEHTDPQRALGNGSGTRRGTSVDIDGLGRLIHALEITHSSMKPRGRRSGAGAATLGYPDNLARP